MMSSAVDLLVIKDSFTNFSLLEASLVVHLNKVILLQEPFYGGAFTHINCNTIHYKHFQLSWLIGPLLFAEVEYSPLNLFILINLFWNS